MFVLKSLEYGVVLFVRPAVFLLLLPVEINYREAEDHQDDHRARDDEPEGFCWVDEDLYSPRTWLHVAGAQEQLRVGDDRAPGLTVALALLRDSEGEVLNVVVRAVKPEKAEWKHEPCHRDSVVLAHHDWVPVALDLCF